MKTVAPYGSWKSTITPQKVTASAPSYEFLQFDNGCLYWLERRPWENGRGVVVQRGIDGKCRDILPAPLNAYSRVHEYGGKPYLVDGDILYFVPIDDQRIYALDFTQRNAKPYSLTPEEPDSGIPTYRFTEMQMDKSRHRLIVVCEDHKKDPAEPKNYLAAIPLDCSQQIEILAEGCDFYAGPRLNPTGDQLSWLSWNHPDMPWDRTCLSIAPIDNQGRLGDPKIVANGENESVLQPQWSAKGELYYISDRSGWWNLYRFSPEDAAPAVKPLLAMDAEFATPLWILGNSCFDFLDSDHIVAAYGLDGFWRLGVLNLKDGSFHDTGQSFSTITDVHAYYGEAWFVASSEKSPNRIFNFWPGNNSCRAIANQQENHIDIDWLSEPETVLYPTDGGDLCHGFFYPPYNPEYTGPDEQLPPLIVMCHGGPTSATSSALNFKIQYWTSRGFAVLDVNYRGSTGFGREYREKLRGNWGIADVNDAANGALFLANQGLVDSERLIIRGSSAGGYTVLAALAFTDTFKAGASLYGIGDLEIMVRDTHKFEAHYLDNLVGPYPKMKEIYQQRSPIYHADRFNCPVIFMQGMNDRVVPPEQAEAMVKALKDRGIPVTWLPFANEGHGFQHAENIHRALEAELYFYGKIFHFMPADFIKPVIIHNLP